jgi:RNA polymerase sigma factor (sigma-70 family)
MMKSDADLLREYHRNQDQSAFSELVARHAGLVYGVATRSLGDEHLARDAAQEVFLLLAKSASGLYAGSGLAGWLHRTTVLTCANRMRKETRRTKLMEAFSENQKTASVADTIAWPSILAKLDDAISRLSERDRTVVIGHFLEGRSYQDIATQANSSEAAVQKRASRAVAKLASWLTRRKLMVTSALLLQRMTSEALASPPIDLAHQVANGTFTGLKSLSWWTVWSHRSREMLRFGKIKFACTLVAAALPIGLGTWGFSQGRDEGRVAKGQALLRADQLAAVASQKKLQATSPTALPPGAGWTVEQIVDAAAAHFLDENDPVGPERADLVMRWLPPDKIPQALAYLGDRIHGKNAIAKKMVPQLLMTWEPTVVKDEAVRWVLEHDAKQLGWLGCAIRPWAQQDALAAREWWRKQPQAESQPGFFQVIYNEFNPEQVESLWKELPTLSVTEERAACNRIGMEMRVPESRQSIFQHVRELPEETMRFRLCDSILRQLGPLDPVAALAWAKDLPLEDPMMKLGLRKKLGDYVGKDHPLEWVRLMGEGMPAEMQEQIKTGAKKTLNK